MAFVDSSPRLCRKSSSLIFVGNLCRQSSSIPLRRFLFVASLCRSETAADCLRRREPAKDFGKGIRQRWVDKGGRQRRIDKEGPDSRIGSEYESSGGAPCL